MKTRLLRILAAVIMATNAAIIAHASTVLFSNPLSLNGGLYSEPAQIIANPFNIPGGGSIDQVSWYGNAAKGTPFGPFSVTFYEDSGGKPGAVLASSPVTPTIVDTGQQNVFFGGQMVLDTYAFTASIPTFSAVAGQAYFFSVESVAETSFAGNFVWADSSGATGAEGSLDGGSSWQNVGAVAFTLLSTGLTPIAYTINVPGALIGTITTDGTIGPLAPKNILAWNLTATVENPLGGPPLTFYFNSATPSTGTQVACGGGGCGVASAASLTFPGASMLELGSVDPNFISFSSSGVSVSSNGNPGMPVTGPVTLGNQPSPDLNQHGLTGSWYEAANSGQGLEFEIYPSTGTGSAFVSWFTFDTVAGGEAAQRWYTAQGPVVAGQPNATLFIYQNTGGNFNALPATKAQVVGTVTLSIFTCTDGHISYSFSDGTGRTGNIALSRLTQNVTCSTTTPYSTNADFALSGNWFDSSIPGQGFTIEVNPISSYLFVAWYTYEPSGVAAGAAGQRWYTAQASFTAGMRSIPVTIYETIGGIFNTPAPAGQQTVTVGMGTLAFPSCTAATFTYNFTGGSSSGLTGTINLGRVGPVPPGCAS